MRSIILGLGVILAAVTATPVAKAQSSDVPQVENARVENKALAGPLAAEMHGLPAASGHFEGDAIKAGVGGFVGFAEVAFNPGIVVLVSYFGGVNRGFQRLDLTEEESKAWCHHQRSHPGAYLETQHAGFRGLQEQLYSALETILERAPSALIEEVARKLTQWAGKFGEEK